MQSAKIFKPAAKFAAATSTACLLAAATQLQAQGDAVSTSLSLDLNTHFISYGAQVWDAENDWDQLLFNPSIGVDFDLGGGWGIYTGAWADINSEGSGGGTGVEELDLWVGTYYSWDIFTIDTNLQAWMYGGDTEGIWDISFSLSTEESLGLELSPTILVHNRIKSGPAGDTGTVLDFGLEYGTSYEDLSISIPLNLGYFVTDEFHGAGGDDGIGYASIGLMLSYPLPISESYGSWDIHGGVKYFSTEEDVTLDTEDSFFTGTIGIGASW